MPGVYLLNDKLSINPVRILKDADRYIIEAQTMPDDSSWTPEKMPVIQSVSENMTLGGHSVGFLISTDNVTIRGLKFLGNSNPAVTRYYPIARENSLLASLEVSQCYFIAEKNSTAIQGAIWAYGDEIKVNHCVFYLCKNGALLFGDKNCAFMNNIVFGAYQTGVWIGNQGTDFVFNNNIITQCDYALMKPIGNKNELSISDCVITDNNHYKGLNKGRDIYENEGEYIENNIVKSGKINLIENNSETLPFNYLHLTPATLGSNLNAGIFKKGNDQNSNMQ